LTFRAIGKPAVQLGVDIDFYAYYGEDMAAAAASTVNYAKRLGANAVSISFPVFADGQLSSAVHATIRTPSPAALSIVVSLAEKAGMYVSIRPLLDEASLGTSRTKWRPANLAQWFASYQAFLLPYAKMAQRAMIPELFNGAEFVRFQTSSWWRGLDKALRGVYTGTLAYANNWGNPIYPAAGGIGVQETVDAYAPISVTARASVAKLSAGWSAYDRTLPAGIIETEAGIAAVPGAYRFPYRFNWKGKPLAPSIQTSWFTALCQAAASNHIGGIYFWSVDLGQPLDVPPSISDPASFVDGPGAKAISGCFASLRSSRP
jgi:hypothetical protein